MQGLKKDKNLCFFAHLFVTLHAMNKKIVVSLCLLMVAGISAAQTENNKSNLFTKAKAFFNRSVVHGVDTNYVKTPSQPWQISVKSRMAQTDLQMHSTIDGTDLFDGESMMPFIMGVGDMAIDPRIMTRVSTSVGVKVGYKGLSVSYSFPVGGDKSQNLTLRGVGNWYSVNLRWHKFKSNTMSTHYSGKVRSRGLIGYDEEANKYMFSDWGETYEWDETETEEVSPPISIKTLIFDGFYIFNHKKFSYAAAYNQKTIQARSVGSPIAGLMAYYADFDYSDKRNAELIYWMGGIGRLRQYQLAVGGGYAYNFVPAKGWLISALAMPMVTLLNQTCINTYESNLEEVMNKHLVEYAIGELFVDGGMKVDKLDFSDEYEIHSTGEYSRNNRVALNFTARLSITYNWSRYFVNANGQFNNFNYKHNAMHGHLNDWYVNASVGVRL